MRTIESAVIVLAVIFWVSFAIGTIKLFGFWYVLAFGVLIVFLTDKINQRGATL